MINMHKIKLLASALMVFAIGVIGTSLTLADGQDHKFNNYGQFNPKYVGSSDGQMLLECEKHGLVYNYDLKQCQTQYEWRMHEAQKQGSVDGSEARD